MDKGADHEHGGGIDPMVLTYQFEGLQDGGVPVEPDEVSLHGQGDFDEDLAQIVVSNGLDVANQLEVQTDQSPEICDLFTKDMPENDIDNEDSACSRPANIRCQADSDILKQI